MAVILGYLSEFAYLPGVLRKSSRSLSHLLMSSCYLLPMIQYQRLGLARKSDINVLNYSTVSVSMLCGLSVML